ncbi:5-hydroxytryptamine receptor 3C-like isoform X2 [Cynoglossus semilaevis]|nr:5-hydroxytryptamine receptor 3C-like isoform X2 [Cynoglossus semilaevis]
MNMSTCTNISTSFTLYGILGVDEKAQLLNTYLWINYWWVNEFISWDPDQCGTDKIALPRDKFWMPDIVINEFMDENTAPYVPYIYIHSDGTVRDAQPAKVVSSCNLDIYNFPFDVQNCTLTFNSYLHYASDIQLFLAKGAEDITEHSKHVMTTMGEWELLDITTNKIRAHQHDMMYIDELIFHISVRRRSTLYVVNLLIPSCFLITVDLFSFLLPPHTVDRSSFKMTLILGYTVFLLIMNDLLPITGNKIPLINVFFSLCLALMVASLLETIIITNLLCGSAKVSSLPHWIQVFIFQILGRLVCLPYKPKSSEPEQRSAEAKPAAEGKTPEQIQGPEMEEKAVQELKSLSKDLQALRLHVEQHFGGSQSSEEWMQCCPPKVKSSKLLFILTFLLMHAGCSSVALNCSRPDTLALLEALTPVFKLNSIRPVINSSTPTTVDISFILFGILGVDEKAQILKTFIWQTLTWKNEFISWDPEECGSSWITVPRTLLWVPDVVINEFMDQNSAPSAPYSYLNSDGRILDAQPVRVISSCKLDIYMFPFDLQNCTFSFNSYLYFKSEIELQLSISAETVDKLSKEVIATMGEWELIGITAKKFELPSTQNGTTYEELRFYISVRRRSTMYVVNMLIPSCFLVTVDLFSFLLPPQSVDRALFKMTLILGYTVLMLNMNDMLPITGNTIPLINVFLSLCLGLMVVSLLETIAVTNLLRGSVHYARLPRWIRVLVLRILGPLVRLPLKPSSRQEDTVISNPAADVEMKPSIRAEQEGSLSSDGSLVELKVLGTELQTVRRLVDKALNQSQSSEEWIQVGLVIDRLLFLLYIGFLLVSFMTIIILWAKSNSIT